MSLAEQICAIEKRFGVAAVRTGVPCEHEELSRLVTGWVDIDHTLGGGLPLAGLHEWFGVASSEPPVPCRNDEARLSAWTPPLTPLIHLVRRSMSCADFARRAVWIGRRCFPYGAVLLGAAGDRRLLERSVFVAAERPDDRLWAIDLALRCPVVGVVVADGRGFDMAATRRIQLAAKTHHTPALLARPPWEADELSAAQTRWLVRWEGATKPRSDEATKGEEDEAALLHPRWRVELLRCKGRPVGLVGQFDSGPCGWALEWDRDEGAVRLSTTVAHPVGAAGLSTNHRRLRQA